MVSLKKELVKLSIFWHVNSRGSAIPVYNMRLNKIRKAKIVLRKKEEVNGN